MTTSFNFNISGSAGEGIKKAGLIFLKTCFKQGFYVHGYTEYPSLIRGGRNTFQVHASKEPNLSPILKPDFTIDLQNEGDLPLTKINQDAGGIPQTKNVAGLGIACFIFNLSLDTLNQTIAKTFSDKSKDVIDLNIKIATYGYSYAKKNLSAKALPKIETQKTEDKLYITGNEAISLGAIAGGLKLFVSYPMTPATSILHSLAAKAKKADLIVRHAEDEIGTINMAIGAGFAGVRSMVATSGGGFSLMTEGLGLSGITETPVVIVNSMRPGPASGMPTWSGQGDLQYMINSSQDEFLRIVMTPGDPEEAFKLSKLALNLAEKYQIPVIILLDKYLSESYFTVNKFKDLQQNTRYGFANPNKTKDKPFKRYQDQESGVSPRTIPGQPGGVHLCNSYEHDEFGYATEESEERIKQVEKRAKKTKYLLNDPNFITPILFGEKEADTTIISWGSNKGVILEALKTLNSVNFIHFPIVWPFPKKTFQKLTQNSKKLITLECNSTGQLNKIITQETGLEIKNQLLKYDGRPFFPSEIISKLL
ncbi:MAG: 2-oxoacid:acceptor oxidoreductase subunit alpha [Candidatus Beckwithbacteria bacterium]